MSPKHPLFVIGHKNPDTDSICSAIAYARFKNEVLGVAAAPYRAGNLNPQTSFVLSRFGVEVPNLLTDVYPKIADIMVQREQLITLREGDTLHDARDLMVSNRFSFLPVIDAEGKCAGQITALRLAGLTQELAEACQQERVVIDLERFVRSVGGRIVAAGASTRFEGKLIIEGIFGGRKAADVPFAFLSPYTEGATLEAIGKGAQVVVACGVEGVAQSAIGRALENGVCLITSPKDILGTTMDLFMAMPVGGFIDRDHPTFNQNDLVRDVQKEIARHNEGGFIVLDDDGFVRGVITRVNFLAQSRFQVAMVDHNEFAQGVDGIEEAEVVEIIDHHRLGNRNTDTPITFINKVVGSTATIVAELYKSHGQNPSDGIAGILLSAILSDTVILKSPTTTQLDRELAEWLASLIGLEVEGYGEEMFAAGSALVGAGPEQIIGQDLKTYTEGDCKFSVSQIEIVGFKKFHEMKVALADALEKTRAQESCSFSCLMVTDITKESSLLLCAGEKKILDAVTYPEVEVGLFEMKGVLSRKKQALPYLLDLVRQL